jgi:hypothetical protein
MKTQPNQNVSHWITRRDPNSEVLLMHNSVIAINNGGSDGLEPAASCATGRRSDQLNYAPRFETQLPLQSANVRELE